MKRLFAYFKSDKEIWLLRLYFILCIVLAIIICHYWGNAFCSHESLSGGFTSIAVVSALLMRIGGFAKSIIHRLKIRR